MDPAEAQRIFVSLGLAAAGEHVAAVPLAGGVSSGIYRVDLRSGRYCVKQALPKLKVAKEWLVPVERVFHEIAWLRAAGAIVPGHVPRVLGSDDASKSFVMEFLGGDHRNWKADLLAGRVDVPVAREVGGLVGRIHAATADSPEMAAKFATDANFHAIRLDPYLGECARSHPRLADRLLDLLDRTAATRRVLVHGDVSPKNILLGPHGPVLLDAECAWFGDPAFDAAFCLNHFLLKAAHRPALAPQFAAAFRAFCDGYAPHVAWEPWPDLEARIATLLPGLSLARVDGKSPVEYLDENARGQVRTASIALLDERPASLEAIATGWERTFSA
jgi:Ser/Thr protein kinase RdoA (MazF antagonist)